MNERISALMDGELDESGLADDLSRLKGSADLRRTWDTYHLIGDVLRDHVTPGFAADVSRRLAAEPTVLAPRRRRTGARRALQVALSAAASVAGVGLVVWMALPTLAPEPAQVAVTPPPAAAPVAVVTPVAVDVENYLLAHQSFSPAGAMQGVAPYVRTVSDQPGGRRK